MSALSVRARTSILHSPITKREKEVLELISLEYTTREIAKKLFVSTYTVDTHRRNILIKLDCKNMAGMIRKGFELGLLSHSNIDNITLSVYGNYKKQVIRSLNYKS